MEKIMIRYALEFRPTFLGAYVVHVFNSLPERNAWVAELPERRERATKADVNREKSAFRRSVKNLEATDFAEYCRAEDEGLIFKIRTVYHF